jgi:hypothetical protein
MDGYYCSDKDVLECCSEIGNVNLSGSIKSSATDNFSLAEQNIFVVFMEDFAILKLWQKRKLMKFVLI